jgi:O-antigen/teichoic acid export membrane protein
VRYRPRLSFDRARARELMHFGKWIFAGHAVAYVGLYADTIAVGRMLGTTALGLYQVAFDLAMMPTATLGVHARGVTFPAFSKLVDTADQRRAFLLTVGVVAAVVVPVAGFVTVFAGPIVRLVLGERWLPIAPALAVLVWAGAATALSGVVNSLFQARGRPEIGVRFAVLQVALWAALFYPLVRAAGRDGMAVAVTVSVVFPLAGRLIVAAREVDARLREVAGCLRPALLALLPLVPAAALAPGRSPGELLAVALAAGLASAGVLAAAFHRSPHWRPRWRAIAGAGATPPA